MINLLKVANDAADAHAVKDSLKDELAAIDKYRRYSREATDKVVRDRLAEIGGDEEHHRDELKKLLARGK